MSSNAADFISKLKRTIKEKDNSGYFNRAVPDESYYTDSTLVSCGNADEPFVKGYTYIFFTKPRLNLFPQPVVHSNNQSVSSKLFNLAVDTIGINSTNQYNNSSDYKSTMTSSHILNLEHPVFKYMFDNGRYEHIKNMLCDINGTQANGSPFIPLLTNRVLSIDLSDETITTNETVTTWQGYALSFPNKTTESKSNGTISFEFTENMNLDVTMLFKAWVTYMDGLRQGTIVPSVNSIANAELDFMSSIYVFVTQPDGRTITHFTRYTGCMPTNVPSSALSGSKNAHDLATVNIEFNYFHKDDMASWIIDDFNEITGFYNNPLIMETRDDTSSMDNFTQYFNPSDIFTNKYKVGIVKDETVGNGMPLHRLVFQ